MGHPNSFRQVSVVMLLLLAVCCACRATPVLEEQTVGSTPPAAATPTVSPPTPTPASAPSTPGAPRPTRVVHPTPVPQPAIRTLGMGRIWDVAVSADGGMLAVSARTGISLYRLDTLEWLRTLGVPAFGETYLAFFRDGAKLVSVGSSRDAALWDVASGERVRALGQEIRISRGEPLSPDGTLLVVSGSDQPLRLRNVATGRVERALSAFSGYALMSTISFSPDGAAVAAGVYTGTVAVETHVSSAIVWDVATGERAYTLDDLPAKPSSLALSPGATVLATGFDDGTVIVWDLASGEPVHALANRGVGEAGSELVFSPDGTVLASTARDGTGATILWDAASGERLYALQTGARFVVDLAFSPDGATLVTGLDDGSVVLWDAATGEPVHVVGGHTGRVDDVVFSPDGATLASAAGNSRLAWPMGVWPVATGSGNATAIVWDAATGRPLRVLKDETRSVVRAALAPDGSTLAFGTLDGRVRLWDVARGELLRTLEGHAGTVYGLAYSPDGSLLASGATDGTIVLWNVKTGHAQRVLGGHEGWVLCMAFSPDGLLLAAGTSEHALVLWKVETGTRLQTLRMRDKDVTRFAFAPDGLVLAVGSSHTRVDLVDVETLNRVGSRSYTARYENPVDCIAFSPNSRLLALGSGDHVTVWDVPSQTLAYELDGPVTTRYRSLAFSHDGAMLAAGSKDGAIDLWHLDEEGAR